MITNAKIIGENTNPADYQKQDYQRGDKRFVMSRGELCAFYYSPSKWINGAKFTGNDSTEWGNLIDTMVTAPDSVSQVFAVQPSHYDTTGMQCPVCQSVTDSAKCSKCKTPRVEVAIKKEWSGQSKTCQEWVANQQAAGKLVVSADDFESAKIAVNRLMKDEIISDFIDWSRKQVMAVAEWHDKATGLVIPLKTLLDFVPDEKHHDFGKSLGDLKTARSAFPKTWNDEVYKRDYHTQAALYLDVYVAATGEDRQDFRHVISENEFPYEPARRWIESDMMEHGRAKYRMALQKYCECLNSNVWPSWDDEGNQMIAGWGQIKLSAWMVKEV